MSSISETQREQIINLLRQEQLSREEIATTVKVSPATVSAIKAHITMGTYDESGISEIETDDLIRSSETTFGLERDLQRALRAEIQQLETGLQIIDNGKERIVDTGRIDITAKDRKDNIVVIELKAGTASPEALTQLLAYMSSIHEQEQKTVRGILIAGDFHSRIVAAARVVPSVQLFRYHFKFTFDMLR